MGRYDLVLRPLTIKNLTLPNRIVFPPFVTGYSSPDGTIHDRQIEFHKTIAASGVGMVIVGATAVAPEGKGYMGNTAIYNDKHIPGLERLFRETQSGSSVAVGIQLYHAGVTTNLKRTGGRPLVAPSPLKSPDTGGIARELTLEEVKDLEIAFVAGARRALSAGADFIEIHAAHGYLINQFLSPLTNKRTDEYGGSFENRARFGLNVMEETRNAVGEDAVVGVRINGDEFTEGGYMLSDAKVFAKWVADKGMDYIHVSGGVTPKGMEELAKGTFTHLASAIRAEVDVPVICVGAIQTLDRAEAILSQGHADLVAIGRALVADPEMINKFLNGKDDDVL
jgi:2,4-dienoyl-CoA reductase-like NADH-dependent reductase (Old Yellow Enzyme family)